MTDLFDLTGKVAVITGAGRGIGEEAAAGLVQAGASVVLVSRTEDQLKKVAERIGQKQAIAVVGDVTSEKDLENVRQKALDKWGTIDILINNAGVTLKKPVLEVSLEQWQNIININLTGQFLCARIIGEQMVKQQKGSIVNVASVGGLIAVTGSVAYCSSKGGVLQMTKVMAAEWAKYNVRVNALLPGWVKTELVEGAMASWPDLKKSILKSNPMERVADPEEMVGGIVFLSSDASSYMTGASLVMDGGMVIQGV